MLPILLGALGGFLYYNFIGCNNGCAITGNPYISTTYGAVIGGVLINWKEMLKSFKNKEKNNEEERGNSR